LRLVGVLALQLPNRRSPDLLRRESIFRAQAAEPRAIRFPLASPRGRNVVERAVYEHVPVRWSAKLRHEEPSPVYDRAAPMEPRE
jgi:hypothetical protein